MARNVSKPGAKTLPQIAAMTRNSRAGVVLAGLLSLPAASCGSEESDADTGAPADLGVPEDSGDTAVDTEIAEDAQDAAEEVDAPAPDVPEDILPMPLYGGPPDTELDVVADTDEDVPVDAPDVVEDAPDVDLDVPVDGSGDAASDASEDVPTVPPYGIPPRDGE